MMHFFRIVERGGIRSFLVDQCEERSQGTRDWLLVRKKCRSIRLALNYLLRPKTAQRIRMLRSGLRFFFLCCVVVILRVQARYMRAMIWRWSSSKSGSPLSNAKSGLAAMLRTI